MSENKKNNRGSEWRKWDLHVHSPASHKFKGGWESFKNQLRDADCDVIGINDYFSVAGYKEIKKEIENKTFDIGNKSIFPVVEMRMTDSVQNRHNETGGVIHFNFHIIFDNKLNVEDIENFIKSLEYNGTTIGKNYDEKEKLINIKVSFEDTLKELNGDKKFKDNFLIWLPYDEYGGIDEIDPNSDGWIKNGFINKSDILGSSNQKQIDFFLWKSPLKKDGSPKFSEEDFKRWFNHKKPCIKGSDSHNATYPIGKLKNKESEPIEKFCWIKAEPTFEGLRQILYEPEDRVKIQREKPEEKDYPVISGIQFKENNDNDEKNFGDKKILLHPNLNTIIGGKSSGKSLLLYCIAKSISPNQIESTFEKLELKPYSFEDSFDFEVTWNDETKQQFKKENIDNNFREDDESKSNKKITYLPQLYISHLADKIKRGKQKEFNDFIKKLLIQNEELKIFLSEKKQEIKTINENINENINEITNCFSENKVVKQKQQEIGKTEEQCQKNIEAIRKEINKIERSSEITDKEKYSKLQNTKNQLQKEIKDAEIKKQKILNIILEINKTSNYLWGNNNQLGKLDNDYDDEIKNILKTFQESYQKTIKELNTKITALNSDISQRKQNLEKTENNIKPFDEKLKTKNNLPKLYESLSLENKKINELKRLNESRQKLKEKYNQHKKNIRNNLEARKKKYIEIKNKINNTQKGDFDTQEIELQATVVFDNRSLYDIFDQRAGYDTPYHDLISEYQSYEIQESGEPYKKLMELFDKILTVENNELKLIDDKKIPLKKYLNLQNVYEEITGDSFTINYNITYKNDDLKNMSPGKAGTILLILYLQISSDKSPILIDQPEDNLDNRTIYNQLVKFIKAKKKDRQIIIVSHNANLVIGTDSENVIVANQSGQNPTSENKKYKFEYANGAIENTFKNECAEGILWKQGIKEHICDILEGGKEAFDQRKKKYNF